ncbi:signal recognition particle subunit SRP54 [Salinibacter ruber]|jgi:signal recognition particle subunit SRP54|uniref:Signal recognition particle protein n=2 Tax=Salinibacter ruber TaxID=146919 RepID=A0A9X2Q482_9BACT|nr:MULTISPECIES: signal recognition particle protein [Salinibacter]MCS3611633.1 signal recognition particle subunit SRP54 [Salinibacter ruber]MCS3626634.1 signal recognition particle subunit SRP54 [Salinibacter ruber]MCS3629800.1 signal recognition particle subunit SRP54 [Salinibacter ruber]MCS3636313.1 signal recognition particle subunit SRP54 [Salinibacter ruber]MCS3646807.1 signal recognition particle subunit SRP54 [Salinibacter ruber]
MFEGLSQKLEGALQSVTGQGRIDEVNVAETMREIRRALLNADVNYQVAKEFTANVKEAATGEDVLTSVTPGEQLTKIMHDELTRVLGGEHEGIEMAETPPTVILVAGLQGSGKTTFCAKLARHFRKEGHAPLLAASDVYRPAAVDQLKTLADQVNAPVYSIEDDGEIVEDAVRVANEAVAEAQNTARDIVIIDTAGRMHIDEAMMQEVEDIKTTVAPNETLFVVDSMTGQDAVNTAKEFNERIDYDGVVLSKLDGDTRGGAALSIRTVVNKPIKFASTGEKLDALTPFYPDRMAQRILGMGDVVSFVERAQEQYDEQEAERLQEKIRSEEFDLQDFYDQLQRIQKMGSIKELMGMIPGVGNKISDLDIDEEAFTHIEAIIQSMTPEERAHPDILNGTRRRRIARGSGNEVRDVNQLVSQFEEMKDMMKTMQKMTSKGQDVDISSLMDKITGGGGGQSRSPR